RIALSKPPFIPIHTEMGAMWEKWGGRMAALGAVLLLLFAVALPSVWRRHQGGDDSRSPAGGAGTTSTAPRRGDSPNTFRFYQEFPHTLDPARAADAYSSEVVAQIYSPLVGLTSDLEPTPQLAESWTISKDGLRYVFRLRPGVHFHNGREVTAQDFAYSLTRVFQEPFLSEGLAANYLDAIDGVREFTARKAKTIRGIRVIDRYQLEITLSRPYPSLLSALALDQTSAVPREVLEEGGPHALESNPVGTGPFRFVRLHPDQAVTLAANDDYFMGRPKLDSLLFIAPPGDVVTAGANALLDGRATLSLLPSNRIEEFRARPGLAVLRWQDLSLSFIGMNASIAPLNDVRVRRAVALAIDRQAMLNALPEGKTLAQGILPPGIPGYSPASKVPHRDLAAAKSLLAQAGYGPNHPLPAISLWKSIGGNDLRQVDSVMVHSLSEAGITVRIRYESWAVLDKAITNRQVPMFGLAWIADIPDPETFLRSLAYSTSASNYFRYDGGRVDSLLDAARATLDADARAELYRRAEEAIILDAPFVPLYYTVSFIGMKDNVAGLEMNPLGISTLAMEKLHLTEPRDGRDRRDASR
ncbi:MAG TPA: ABC transporter substrate-binding protein, partial [Candidatus Eisenbacteria bacterium]|nr:ABC transporter substrate-binding protein [Candidatus Eisenbacteria bacterium]